MSDLKRLGLEDCDDWCRAPSVTSKSTVKTFGFVIEDFENVMKESKMVTSSQFNIEDFKWTIRVYNDDYDDGAPSIGNFYAKKGFIGIWIFSENSDKTFELEGKVTCSGKSYKLYEPDRNSIVELKALTGFGWSHPVRYDQCTKSLIDGKLVVKAELSLVKRGDLKVSGGNEEGSESNENLLAKLVEKIYSERVFCDFKLISNHLEFDCHRNFIASQSETLRNAVERWAPDGKMILNEFKPEVIEVLINFFYRRPLDSEVLSENAVEFLNIGEQYDLPPLKAKAEMTMMANLNKETFLDFFIAGDLYAAAKIKEEALRFLARNRNLWTENFSEWNVKLAERPKLLMEIITAFST